MIQTATQAYRLKYCRFSDIMEQAILIMQIYGQARQVAVIVVKQFVMQQARSTYALVGTTDALFAENSHRYVVIQLVPSRCKHISYNKTN
jgi:hypothetical protein